MNSRTILALSPALLLSLCALSGAALGGCGDEEDSNAQPTGTAGASGAAGSGGTAGVGGTSAGGAGTSGESSAIRFEARVGEEAFSCAKTFEGLGTQKNKIEPLDFRLYIHDIRLVDDKGAEVPFELEQDGVWQYKGVALLDFEDKTGSCVNGTEVTHTTLQGKAPAGVYKGLKFKVGVPFELNHADSAVAPSPLNLSTMFWSWNGGYKFLRLDAKVTDGAPKNLHLGSTGCQGDGNAVTSCANPNRPEIELSGFDPLQGKILLDYAAIMATTDLSQDGGGAPGCMSGVDDPECATIFPALGLSLQTGAPATGQAAFRVGE